jgi:Uma2 family endonuclease
MNEAVQHQRPRMTIGTFRAWSALRPDNERWELIGGVPAMMTPPTMKHQRIASNLEARLNAGLRLANPGLVAYQRVGVNLGVEFYDPEPDVVVVDRPASDEERYADRFYLAAEVVSDSDRRTLDDKCRLYRDHLHCRCILVIRQDRQEVRLDRRTPDGAWTSLVLATPDDKLVVDDFVLHCLIADFYAEP